jgi:hypothetical protein
MDKIEKSAWANEFVGIIESKLFIKENSPFYNIIFYFKNYPNVQKTIKNIVGGKPYYIVSLKKNE